MELHYPASTVPDSRPIPAVQSHRITSLCRQNTNRPLVDHFHNFFEAVVARQEPISDVFSHHRALSTCHLAGIAARLNRKIKWDPQAEQMIDDEQAQCFVSRAARKGFETIV